MGKDDGYGAPEHDNVDPYAPVVDVPAVHVDALGVVDVAAAAGLPHAGDAGAYHVVVFDVVAIEMNFFPHDGTGADEAHFSFEDVQELGEFVQAGPAEKVAGTGDSRVIFQFERGFPFFLRRWIGCEEFLEALRGVDAHGAEFVAVKFFPVFPNTAVLVDDGARGVAVDPEGDTEEDGGNEETSYDGHDDIKSALDEAVRRFCQVVFHVEDHDFFVEEGFYGDVAHGDSHEVWDDAYVFADGLGAVDEGRQLVLGEAGSGDENGLDAGFFHHFFHVIEAAQNGVVPEEVGLRLAVFEKTDDIVFHAGVFPDFPDHRVRREAGADDEDWRLKKMRFNKDAPDDPAESEKHREAEYNEKSHIEPGHLSRYVRRVHEEHGEKETIETGIEKFFCHLPEKDFLFVQFLYKNKGYKKKGNEKIGIHCVHMEVIAVHPIVPHSQCDQFC